MRVFVVSSDDLEPVNAFCTEIKDLQPRIKCCKKTT